MTLHTEIFGDLELAAKDYWLWYDGPQVWPAKDSSNRLYLIYYFDDDFVLHPETKKIVKSSITYWIIPSNQEMIDRVDKGLITIRDFFYSSPTLYLHTDGYVGCESKTIEVVDRTLPYYDKGIPDQGVYLPYEKEDDENGQQD